MIQDQRRRRAMFGHVRRLPEVTPVNMALHLAVKAGQVVQ